MYVSFKQTYFPLLLLTTSIDCNVQQSFSS